MGYTTEFWGQVELTPALNTQEIAYLKKFNETRRMHRTNGDYYCGTGHAGQDHEADIINYNAPPPEQPSLWCQWTPSDDGKYIEWDGGEKFYSSPEWMWYLIHHFLKPNPLAKIRQPETFSFLQGHVCKGEIDAQGEEGGDRWKLVVDNNKVYVQRGSLIFKEKEEVGNDLLDAKYCLEENINTEKCGQCDKRYKCYTTENQPIEKYGSWGDKTFWTANH